MVTRGENPSPLPKAPVRREDGRVALERASKIVWPASVTLQPLEISPSCLSTSRQLINPPVDACTPPTADARALLDWSDLGVSSLLLTGTDGGLDVASVSDTLLL